MPPFAWNRTLLIANPAAQSGRGAQGAREVERALREASTGKIHLGAPDRPNGPSDLEVMLTERPGHAVELAERHGGSCDTVVALGGDGIIHEVVNGLMRVPENRRPCLAVVPLGSGNDFARTLGMPRNRPDRTLRAIARGARRQFDLGCVNGTYFMQTLSFGLDAAIALATMERRAKNGAHGTRLFAATGFDVLAHNREPFAFRAEFETIDAGGVPAPSASTAKRSSSRCRSARPTAGASASVPTHRRPTACSTCAARSSCPRSRARSPCSRSRASACTPGRASCDSRGSNA